MSVRPGWLAYAGYLRALVGVQLSAAELAEKCTMQHDSALDILKRWKWFGRVHIAGWRKSKKGPCTALWTYGRGEDAPYPNDALARPRYAPERPSAEIIVVESLLVALEEGGQSANTLAQETGVSANRAREFLRGMLNELGMVYIESWERRRGTNAGGNPTPFYRLGMGRKSAPRPTPFPPNEKAKRMRAIKRARKQHLRIAMALAANASVFHQAA